MKNFLTAILAIATTFGGGSVMAYSISGSLGAVAAGGTVYRTINHSTVRTLGGQMRFENVSTDFDTDIGLNTLYGWCIEPDESISYNQSVEWSLEDLNAGNNQIGGMGEQRANYLRELFHFAMPDFSVLGTVQEGLALQMATWEIVTDDDLGNFNLTSGSTQFSNSNRAGAISLAQGWLDAVVNDGVQDAMLNNLYAATVNGTQDMIFQLNGGLLVPPSEGNAEVPVPASAWLLLSGLGALAGMRRRRH